MQARRGGGPRHMWGRGKGSTHASHQAGKGKGESEAAAAKGMGTGKGKGTRESEAEPAVVNPYVIRDALRHDPSSASEHDSRSRSRSVSPDPCCLRPTCLMPCVHCNAGLINQLADVQVRPPGKGKMPLTQATATDWFQRRFQGILMPSRGGRGRTTRYREDSRSRSRSGDRFEALCGRCAAPCVFCYAWMISQLPVLAT